MVKRRHVAQIFELHYIRGWSVLTPYKHVGITWTPCVCSIRSVRSLYSLYSIVTCTGACDYKALYKKF